METIGTIAKLLAPSIVSLDGIRTEAEAVCGHSELAGCISEFPVMTKERTPLDFQGPSHELYL